MLGLRGRQQYSDKRSNRNGAPRVASTAVGTEVVENGFLRNISTDSKKTTFVILKNHTSAPIRKKELSPTSKAKKEGQPKSVYRKGRDARQNQKLLGSR